MRNNKLTIVALFALLLVGCGAAPDNKKAEAQRIIPEHQLKALEKAKGVEKTLLDAETKRKKAMEKSGI